MLFSSKFRSIKTFPSCELSGNMPLYVLVQLGANWGPQFEGRSWAGLQYESTITMEFGEVLSCCQPREVVVGLLSPDPVPLNSLLISLEQRWKQSDLLSNFSSDSAFCFPHPEGVLSGWQVLLENKDVCYGLLCSCRRWRRCRQKFDWSPKWT